MVYKMKRATLAEIKAMVPARETFTDEDGNEVVVSPGWDAATWPQRLQALHDAHVWPVVTGTDANGDPVLATDADGKILYDCSYVTQGFERQRNKPPNLPEETSDLATIEERYRDLYAEVPGSTPPVYRLTVEPFAEDPTPGETLSEGYDTPDAANATSRTLDLPAEIRKRVRMTTVFYDRTGASLRAAVNDVALERTKGTPAANGGFTPGVNSRQPISELPSEDRLTILNHVRRRLADEADPVAVKRVPLKAVEDDPDGSGWIVVGDDVPPRRFLGRQG